MTAASAGEGVIAFMNAAFGLRLVAAFLAVFGAAFFAVLFFAADFAPPVFFAAVFLPADPFLAADFFVAFLAVAIVLLPVNGRATCTTPNPLKQTLPVNGYPLLHRGKLYRIPRGKIALRTAFFEACRRCCMLCTGPRVQHFAHSPRRRCGTAPRRSTRLRLMHW